MSSEAVGNITRSNGTPIELGLSSFGNQVIQPEVNPEFNVRHTIHVITHPFSYDRMQPKNMDLYKGIISEVAQNPNSSLYYIATHANIRDLHDPKLDQYRDFSHEIELQKILNQQPEEVAQRIALFTDTTGDNSIYAEGYKPGGIMDIVKSSSPSYYSLSWFAENGVKTYYTPDLTKAYTDISGLTQIQRSEIGKRSNADAEFLVGGSKTFLKVSLHPQVGKLIKLLGVRQDFEGIEGTSLFTLDNEKKRNTEIVAYGENLESDGFGESMRLAILLGLPLKNVSFNKEQPYLPERERERAYFRRPPIEALYPPEYYLGSSNRGRLR